MANPFNHHNHHRYDAEDDQPYPPPSTYPPPPPFSSFPNQPPPYPNQSPPYPPYPHHSQPYPPYPQQSQPYPPYQPPAYPPPAQSTGVYHTSHSGVDSHAYPPPPTASYAHHDSHSSAPTGGGGGSEHHHHHPHMPGFIADHIHHGHQSSEGGPIPELAKKPSVRVYTKADTNYMLAIRDGKVILARSDPNDPTQHWVKDETHSTKVKDQDGYPSFALVNKATGQALKHSIGATHPVQLTAYKTDGLDESILWTVGKDLGGGYRQIRMINNIRLVVDAVDGDKKHGGVRDGTTIALWQPGKGDNQRWKIEPY